MRLDEIKTTNTSLKTFWAKVKLQQSGYSQIVDIAIQATNQATAIRLIKSIYGANNLIGNPRQEGQDYK